MWGGLGFAEKVVVCSIRYPCFNVSDPLVYGTFVLILEIYIIITVSPNETWLRIGECRSDYLVHLLAV